MYRIFSECEATILMMKSGSRTPYIKAYHGQRLRIQVAGFLKYFIRQISPSVDQVYWTETLPLNSEKLSSFLMDVALCNLHRNAILLADLDSDEMIQSVYPKGMLTDRWPVLLTPMSQDECDQLSEIGEHGFSIPFCLAESCMKAALRFDQLAIKHTLLLDGTSCNEVLSVRQTDTGS